MAADGGKADIARPMKGLGAGVLEISVSFNRAAFRTIYCLQIGTDLWVVHAFQKKSKQGIKTPGHVIETIRNRIKRLKEELG